MQQQAPPSLTSPSASSNPDYLFQVAHFSRLQKAAHRTKASGPRTLTLSHRTPPARLARQQHPYKRGLHVANDTHTKLPVDDDRGFFDAVVQLEDQHRADEPQEPWYAGVVDVITRLPQNIRRFFRFFA